MRIKMILTDVDGCLTDGSVYYGPNHEKFKKFNMQDGMAVKILKHNKILVGVISSDDSMATKYRMEDLKFDIICIDVKDKLEKFKEILYYYNVDAKEVAYMGDDIQDLDVIKAASFSVAPNNAVESVKEKVNYVTKKCGGEGAFREFVEKVIEMNGGDISESCSISTNKT